MDLHDLHRAMDGHAERTRVDLVGRVYEAAIALGDAAAVWLVGGSDRVRLTGMAANVAVELLSHGTTFTARLSPRHDVDLRGRAREAALFQLPLEVFDGDGAPVATFLLTFNVDRDP